MNTIGEVFYRWSFLHFVFDEARWQLLINDQIIDIEVKPLEILAYLLRHTGRVVTKDELLEQVWPGRIVVEASLTNAITKLRKALYVENQEIISTIPRIGYRLVANINRKSIANPTPTAQIKQGEAAPRRPNFRLIKCLDKNEHSEIWYSEHYKTREQRVFKFSLDGTRLESLRREATVSRLLNQSLGDRKDILRVLDWDFEQAPYFLECEYGGADLNTWDQDIGGLAQLSEGERIRLMAEICQTVAAAHSVGVLHKDLKPSNILVFAQDGIWKPRIADFGCARLLEPGRLAALGITPLNNDSEKLHDEQSSTPLYSAPELLQGQPSTVQSDVYALGVMLYQLLVCDFKQQLSPGWESRIASSLLREDISLAAAGSSADRLSSAAELAHRLTHLTERQATNDALAKLADNARLLEAKVKKSKARRPWLVATFSTLAIGLGASLYYYQQANSERLLALKQVQITRAVNQFLHNDILAAANPVSAGHIGITVKEALDKSADQIDKRYAGQPEAAADIHQIVGTAYYQSSEHEKALAQYQLAAENYRTADGENSVRALQVEAMRAETLARMSRYKEAKILLDDLKTKIDKRGDEARLASVFYDRASSWWHFNQMQYKETVPPLEHALLQLADMPDADPAIEENITQALMVARQFAGYPLESLEQIQNRLVKNLVKQKGVSAPITLSARYAAARTQMILGRERDLEPTYLELYRDMSRTLGSNSESALLIQHSLAVIYSKQERWQDSERSSRRAYYGLTNLMGADSSNTYIASSTYAVALLRTGKPQQAIELLKSKINDLGKRDDRAAKLIRVAMKVNLAHCYIETSQIALAKPLVVNLAIEGETLIKLDTDAAGEISYLEGAVITDPKQKNFAVTKLNTGIAELSKKNLPEYWIIRNANAALAKWGMSSKI